MDPGHLGSPEYPHRPLSQYSYPVMIFLSMAYWVNEATPLPEPRNIRYQAGMFYQHRATATACITSVENSRSLSQEIFSYPKVSAIVPKGTT